MKTLPTLNFYANHNLDFENSDIDHLRYYAISELRKFPTPDIILQIVHNSLCLQFPDGDLSRFESIKNWCPISFPGSSPEMQKILDRHITSIGPLGMRIVFTPQRIILPSIIYDCADWYSPLNKEKVQAIRTYYYTVINHFGGDHALYVDEKITKKYYDTKHTPNSAALNAFEQTLVTRYGTSTKTLFDYLHGKFPKYYIDTFPDLLQNQ
jgi:hypothetical protein